jgi:DNA-binding transcriptional LysR family regulator
MSHIDVNDIRKLDGGLLLVFRELLRHRQTTAAAYRLGLTQSTVSHALNRLRELFHDPLFVRRPHGLEPTQRALSLGPRIDALIDLASETLRRDGGFDASQSERRFRLAAAEFVIALIGAPLIATLRRSAPRVSFEIITARQERALEALRRGEVDLAIGRYGALPRGLVAEPLYDDRYCVVARKAHPRLKGRISITAYNSIGHVFAGAPGEATADEPVPSPRVIATLAVVPRWLSALLIVSATDAIATCPEQLARSQAKRLGLQVLAAPFPQKPFTVSLVRREAGDDAGMAWFAKEIRECLRD